MDKQQNEDDEKKQRRNRLIRLFTFSWLSNILGTAEHHKIYLSNKRPQKNNRDRRSFHYNDKEDLP